MKSSFIALFIAILCGVNTLLGSIDTKKIELDRTGDGQADISIEISHREGQPVSMKVDWYGEVGVVFYFRDGNAMMLADSTGDHFLDRMLYFDDDFNLLDGFNRKSENVIEPLTSEILDTERSKWEDMISGLQTTARSVLQDH